MKISTNCSSLVILGDDFFSSPPFSFFLFFLAYKINELPQQGTWGPFYNKQINNKHIIYQRGGFLYLRTVVSGSICELAFDSPFIYIMSFFRF